MKARQVLILGLHRDRYNWREGQSVISFLRSSGSTEIVNETFEPPEDLVEKAPFTALHVNDEYFEYDEVLDLFGHTLCYSYEIDRERPRSFPLLLLFLWLKENGQISERSLVEILTKFFLMEKLVASSVLSLFQEMPNVVSQLDSDGQLRFISVHSLTQRDDHSLGEGEGSATDVTIKTSDKKYRENTENGEPKSDATDGRLFLSYLHQWRTESAHKHLLEITKVVERFSDFQWSEKSEFSFDWQESFEEELLQLASDFLDLGLRDEARTVVGRIVDEALGENQNDAIAVKTLSLLVDRCNESYGRNIATICKGLDINVWGLFLKRYSVELIEDGRLARLPSSKRFQLFGGLQDLSEEHSCWTN